MEGARLSASRTLLVCIALLLPVIVVMAPTASADETGAFPSRTFVITRAGGDPHGQTYWSHMTPSASGTYSVTLDLLEGTSTVVQLYESIGGTSTLLAESKLRHVGEQLSSRQLVLGHSYSIAITNVGKPGSSTLHETYVLTGPTACLAISPSGPVVGTETTFDGSCSTDPDPNIVSYAWDFGDSSLGSGATTTHTYQTWGTFTVSLVVVDALGDADSISESVFVAPATTVFTGSFSDSATDSDNDGLYDFLIVDAGVYVVEGGPFDLVGFLSKGPGDRQIKSGWTVDLGIGSQSVELSFAGSYVRTLGVDGPYNVELSLYAGGTLVTSGSFSTSPYRYTRFDLAPGAFIPPHSDFGSDTDGDGGFNYLVVDARVEVAASVSYRLIARIDALGLVSDYYPFIEAGGVRSVPAYFDGLAIRKSGVDGPYRVSLELQDYWGNPLDSSEHVTAAYLHTDFESQPAAILPAPFLTETFDTDGDGAINWLVATIGVDVYEAGFYEVVASLRHPESGTRFAGSTGGSILDPGLQSFIVDFDGTQVYNSGLDGPYSIDVDLWDGPGSVPIDTASQLTDAYRYTDFDPPSARLVPPHSDAGEDTDGDGLYDVIAILVNVEVIEPGTFSISGYIPSGGGFAADQIEATLDAGMHQLTLHLDAVAFFQAGVDGPFLVTLSAYDSSRGSYLGSDTFWTAPYAHASLDPPGASFGEGHSAVPIDADGDGLYENLEVHVALVVDRAGWYEVGAALLSADYQFQIYDSVTVYLEPGAHEVAVPFSGYLIKSSGKDGPYSISLTLLNAFPGTGMIGACLGSGGFQTLPYSYTNFE